jgi:hypothetical protein
MMNDSTLRTWLLCGCLLALAGAPACGQTTPSSPSGTSSALTNKVDDDHDGKIDEAGETADGDGSEKKCGKKAHKSKDEADEEKADAATPDVEEVDEPKGDAAVADDHEEADEPKGDAAVADDHADGESDDDQGEEACAD